LVNNLQKMLILENINLFQILVYMDSLPEGEVEVLLIVRPVESIPADRWPESFFENTCGRWIGELERPSVGDYETRPALSSDEVSA
jgi:hypothetical protein